jgi:hypothetical protein
MKPSLTLMVILFMVSAVTRAQVAPAANIPNGLPGLPNLPVSGTLRYDLHYSQTVQFYGGSGGDTQNSILSGDASYANTSKRLPFSLQYGGGFSWVLTGPPSAGNVFQHLSVSQGMAWRKCNLTASDNISYTFETPTMGFSGVPGTGEPIAGSGTTTTPDQTILTLNTRSLDNVTTLAFTDKLSYATTLNLGGSWGEMRFIDNNGQNTEMLTGNAGITRRLDAHDSVSGQFSFSQYNYSGAGYSTQSSAALFSVTRQWNQKLTTTAAAGPEWISSSGTSSSGSLAIPSSTMLSLNASANYRLRNGSASLSYSHGTTGGSGYMLGAKEDSVNGNYSRQFGKNTTVGVTGSYTRSSALTAAEFVAVCPSGSTSCFCPSGDNVCILQVTSTPVTDARYGGVQATRKLGRYFNIFASYAAIDQSSNLQTQISAQNQQSSYNTNILNGINQVISFGIGYSPREKRLKK